MEAGVFASISRLCVILWIPTLLRSVASIDVVIIGAGPSGIAAATRLLENGIDDVIILEAKNRIGGRIHTIPFGDGESVEMGAQWVHGKSNNIVYELVEPYELLTVDDDIVSCDWTNNETSAEYYFSGSTYVTSSGRIVNTDNASVFDDMLKELEELPFEGVSSLYKSVGSFYTSEFHKILVQQGMTSEEDIRNGTMFLGWFHRLINNVDGCDDWNQLSTTTFTEYWYSAGGDMSWRTNYTTLLHILMKKYPYPENALPLEEKIHLGKEVTKIIWNDTASNQATIECKDGSTYNASHVIVTMSLGVLKEKAESMFEPGLPNEKLNAIKGLGFGVANKFFLKFPHRWWSNTTRGFSLLWEGDADSSTEVNPQNIATWKYEISYFSDVLSKPSLMMTFITGDAARMTETLPDEEIVSTLMSVLRQMLPNQVIPEPVAFIRSKWSTDEHFRGSYSYRSLDSDALDTSAEKLAEPIFNRDGRTFLQFAGEATSSHYYSTVHGAVGSGWREADRLISERKLD